LSKDHLADGDSGQFSSNSNELQILNMTLCAMAKDHLSVKKSQGPNLHNIVRQS